MMRRFLVRDPWQGSTVVAYGTVFGGGPVAVYWLAEPSSVVTNPCMDRFHHAHHGYKIEYLDGNDLQVAELLAYQRGFHDGVLSTQLVSAEE